MLPLALLLLSSGADPARVTPNVVPAPAVEVRAAVGSLVTLNGAAGSTWTLAEGSCGFWPDGAVCRVTKLDGPARIIVIETLAGDVKRHAVCFDGPQPMPPGPGPAPVPVPPTPVPPQPVDPLKATLTAAFNADAGDAAQKKEDVLQLAALYVAAVDICTDPSLKTPRELLTKVRGAGDSLTKDRLAKLREAFKIELQAVLPALDSPLTADSRAKAADLFKRAEVILEALGKPTK